MLNELASPQRLAYAFPQALFCRVTAFGDHCYSTSLAVAEHTVSFASTRRLALKRPTRPVHRRLLHCRVPLKFRAIAAPALPRLADVLRPEKLELREGEVVAVNCVGALQRAGCGDSWDSFLRAAAALRPRVLTVVEDEADFGEFMESFEECLRFYDSYFEMLEESFPATCNKRLALERECFRSLVGLLACEGDANAVVDGERRERGRQWCQRLERCGFETFDVSDVSDDIIDDLKALLKRYRPGWSLLPAEGETSGMYLTWKDKIENLFDSHY
ncbi:hypothetical protein ZIOFF_054879 [Zingiber officinale]|uniref:Uncharacterized protein n=1 Tax=Zingiber officinale TaxID=94328 RepID=A0A8J5FE72_ZINOF|nr:hypothetical protein ZIOFF_054879 [Zingiber officinale]